MIKSLVCGGLGEDIRHLVTRGLEIGAAIPAFKHIIARGIGFNPGSVKYLVTGGIGIGAVALPTPGRTFYNTFIVDTAERIFVLDTDFRIFNTRTR